MDKEVEEIKKVLKVLNSDFENIWDWFVDNKLSIGFDEERPNCFSLQVNVNSKL